MWISQADSKWPTAFDSSEEVDWLKSAQAGLGTTCSWIVEAKCFDLQLHVVFVFISNNKIWIILYIHIPPSTPKSHKKNNHCKFTNLEKRSMPSHQNHRKCTKISETRLHPQSPDSAVLQDMHQFSVNLDLLKSSASKHFVMASLHNCTSSWKTSVKSLYG